jgi:cytochrome b involved in lipid metabolism
MQDSADEASASRGASPVHLNAAGATGSASNSMPPPPPPRLPSAAKYAIRPGFSPMHWAQKAKALSQKAAGTEPRLRQRARGDAAVSRTELAQHAGESDAWTAVAGTVYDVTAYIPYHPGGVANILKGAGRDSTAMFNRHHHWVNHAHVLDGFKVGALTPRGQEDAGAEGE